MQDAQQIVEEANRKAQRVKVQMRQNGRWIILCKGFEICGNSIVGKTVKKQKGTLGWVKIFFKEIFCATYPGQPTPQT